MLSSASLANASAYRAAFDSTAPCRYVCMDDFLQPQAIDALVQSFPSSSSEDYAHFCIEDSGKPGTNYANGKPETFPAEYRALDQLLASAPFIAFLESVTGIDGLLYDPDYQGGGLRESRRGNYSPVHLDFNRHPKTGWHRRLNLLLYLNEGWQEDWGGHIQMHRDPRAHPDDSLVAGFAPLKNRCFLFETSEHSWHGFSRITCPSERGRKAVSIYYFTPTRPEGEVSFRNTEYVEPGLPAHLRPGATLSDEDVEWLQTLLRNRDERIETLYALRRGHDAKYTHLWAEYEYYLSKYKAYRERFGDLG